MKVIKNFVLIFCFFSISQQIYTDSTLDSLKGVWSSIKSFPLFSASFWKGIGRGFGAPPTGYVYSFMVHNETDKPVWVATQDLASVMGGVFPEASGWNCTKIDPYKAYGQDNKEYYFELFIKTTSKSYSNHMPYLQHSDVLYQLEKINLIPTDKNSKHRNHFRIYMGKDFDKGSYAYNLKAELVGYENMVQGSKDKNAITISSNLSALSIKNSTQNDYYIGFTSEQVSTISSLDMCEMTGFLEKDSFGLLSAVGSIKSLRPGSIGIFSNPKSAAILTMPIPEYGFDNFSYTLEIYQDKLTNTLACQWQGITPGHYDMPTNRVKDITPVIGCFWYQSAAQIQSKNMVDLPGKIWIVSLEEQSKKGKILAVTQPGQVVQFLIERPNISDKNQIYFIYLDEKDIKKSEAFLQRFLSGTIGQDALKLYHQNLEEIMQNKAVQLIPVTSGKDKSAQQIIPKSLIDQLAATSFQMDRGQIKDTLLNVTGFLLGYDLFLSLGIGSQPFYYVLSPSYLVTSQNYLPTSSVNNLLTKSPKGLPSTTINSSYAPTKYSIA